jgi:hypothetical protein
MDTQPLSFPQQLQQNLATASKDKDPGSIRIGDILHGIQKCTGKEADAIKKLPLHKQLKRIVTLYASNKNDLGIITPLLKELPGAELLKTTTRVKLRVATMDPTKNPFKLSWRYLSTLISEARKTFSLYKKGTPLTTRRAPFIAFETQCTEAKALLERYKSIQKNPTSKEQSTQLTDLSRELLEKQTGLNEAFLALQKQIPSLLKDDLPEYSYLSKEIINPPSLPSAAVSTSPRPAQEPNFSSQENPPAIVAQPEPSNPPSTPSAAMSVSSSPAQKPNIPPQETPPAQIASPKATNPPSHPTKAKKTTHQKLALAKKGPHPVVKRSPMLLLQKNLPPKIAQTRPEATISPEPSKEEQTARENAFIKQKVETFLRPYLNREITKDNPNRPSLISQILPEMKREFPNTILTDNQAIHHMLSCYLEASAQACLSPIRFLKGMDHKELRIAEQQRLDRKALPQFTEALNHSLKIDFKEMKLIDTEIVFLAKWALHHTPIFDYIAPLSEQWRERIKELKDKDLDKIIDSFL